MKMRYNEPAKAYLEALPVGNGRIGGMVYGDPNDERICLNEDTLWSGYPVKEYRGLRLDTLKKAKRQIGSKHYSEAMHTLESDLMMSEDVQMYLPFGDINLRFTDGGEITEYKRTLSLDSSVFEARYKRNGKRFIQSCFCSHPAQALIYHVAAEAPFGLEISGKGAFITEISYHEQGVVMRGQCPGRASFTVGDSEQNKVHHLHTAGRETRGMAFEGHIGIHTDGGERSVKGESIRLNHIRECTIVVQIRSSFNGFDKHPVLDGADYEKLLLEDEKKARYPYEKLLADHIADYGKYYNRVRLQLTKDADMELDVIDAFCNQTDADMSLALQNILFDYGRYLLISSSRSETQAANLQGIWNNEAIPPWFSDYTVNINTEMNYWMTGPLGLPELLWPLVKLAEDMTVTGERTAKTCLGKKGAASFHNVDIWRKTSPANGRAMWAYWSFGLTWICRNLFDQYLFTTDKDYLKRIEPIITKSTLFCLNMLEETDEGLAVTLATSPENEFVLDSEMISTAYYTENVHAIIRGIFRDYIHMCEELHIEGEELWRVKDALPRIVPVKVGAKGQILEWNEEFQEADIHHRHVSHLYELHPGTGITRTTKELFDAARTSLLIRGDDGTGWSLAWKVLMWARLLDGEHVQSILSNLFRLVSPEHTTTSQKGGLYPNLFCAHPPFQIDGNFGYTAGIAEALLQSHTDEIMILPAKLPIWSRGSVKGLKARGNIDVCIEWNENRITYTLKATSDQTIKLFVGGISAGEVSLLANVPYTGSKLVGTKEENEYDK